MKILMPAYNPTEKLINLIEDIKKLTDIPIIIVNDGSAQKFSDIFKKLEKDGITVLNHKVNLGKGEAIRTGIKYLIDIQESDGVVCADCDGQHSPKDIKNIIDVLSNSNVDLVLRCKKF